MQANNVPDDGFRPTTAISISELWRDEFKEKYRGQFEDFEEDFTIFLIPFHGA